MEPFGLFRFFRAPTPQSGDPRTKEPSPPQITESEREILSANATTKISEKENAFLSFAAAHEARSKRLKKR